MAEDCPSLGARQWILIAIGSVVILRIILRIAQTFNKFVLHGETNLRRFGEWAVVTGSTDGIGKEYALQFAKRGLNIVLVSRTQSRLEDVAAELRALPHPVQVKTVVADLASLAPGTLEAVASEIEGLDVGILVNNAGMSHDHPDYLETYTEEHLLQLINLNLVSLTLLTRLVLPGMKARRRGLIVNLSSGAAALPVCPLLSAYTASKSYVDSFSLSLAEETRAFNVLVDVPAALFVATKMSKVKKPRRDVPSARDWVKAYLRQAGRGQTVGFPYYYHAWLAFLLGAFPASASRAVILRTNLATRRAYYRKEARRQAALAAEQAPEDGAAGPGPEPKKDA